MQEKLRGDLTESMAAIEATIATCLPDVTAAAEAVVECYRAGGKVLIAGNGGSAADAQHFAGEMLGWFLDRERRPLPAIALTTDTSVLTSIANDASVEAIFARQVEGHGQAGDAFIGISTSGASATILEAMKTAKALGMTTIALCGKPGSPIAESVDIAISVPAELTPHIQIAHASVLHGICRMVDEES